MPRVDLSKLPWRLEGWRPFLWRLGRNTSFQPELGPLEAFVPGSVQEALRRAGLLPDWNVGLKSRECEWVEHRHWIFEAEIPAGCVPDHTEADLVAEGLDYSGWVLVDGVEVGRFEGTLLTHRFALGSVLGDGQPHRLALVFEEPPREQGQIGYTSASRFFKPRYTYSWDWCPRVVPIGVWEPLYLETGLAHEMRLDMLRTDLDQDLKTGAVSLRASGPDGQALRAALLDGTTCLAAAEARVEDGTCTIRLGKVPVEAWWPNGLGTAKTYTVQLSATDAAGNVIWHEERTVGFKRVEWRACEGAPADAEPWICVVNGRPVFLQGVNWVPPRISYPDSTEEDYARLLTLYREMGCNVFRVWGGAILEKDFFYELCDRNGILVWQEFPLSHNEPPGWRNPTPGSSRQMVQPSLALTKSTSEPTEAKVEPSISSSSTTNSKRSSSKLIKPTTAIESRSGSAPSSWVSRSNWADAPPRFRTSSRIDSTSFFVSKTHSSW